MYASQSCWAHRRTAILSPVLSAFTMSQDGPPLGDLNDGNDFGVPIRLQFSVQDGNLPPPAASAADDQGDALEVRNCSTWIKYSAPV